MVVRRPRARFMVMKWSVKLVAETAPGAITEHDLLTLERPDQLTLARLGLSLEETKRLLAALQHQLVAAGPPHQSGSERLKGAAGVSMLKLA
jgi:hypothetical protein